MSTLKEEQRKRYDGGAAFPLAVDCSAGTRVEHERGMTLRDYFAGAMLNGIAQAAHKSGYTDEIRFIEGRARFAYAMADAMLAERAK